ncbi:redoxin family protein [Thermodesulfobacteriota bacterium]
MKPHKTLFAILLILYSINLAACTTIVPFPVDTSSVTPGSKITRNHKEFALLGTPISIRVSLPSATLYDSANFKERDLSTSQGKVLLLSIVSSLDTAVCEAQTHYLGEQGDRLPKSVERITISRDTPDSQRRFAKEAGLKDITFLSDYKTGDFGRSLGLLIDDVMLLARSVIVVDKNGFVRYIQVVPEQTNLPDMEAAFLEAEQLAARD